MAHNNSGLLARMPAFARNKSFDVEFIFRQINDSITAHTNKLREISPLFEAMFGPRGTKESMTGCVLIEDVGPQVFQLLLTYIYHGEITLKRNIVQDLLISTNKYEIYHLGEICIKLMGKNIDGKNVVDTLAFCFRTDCLPISLKN